MALLFKDVRHWPAAVTVCSAELYDTITWNARGYVFTAVTEGFHETVEVDHDDNFVFVCRALFDEQVNGIAFVD